MKNIQKLYVIFIGLLMGMFLLSGCANSDGRVRKDVEELFVSNYSYIKFDDVDSELVQRQTNSREKTDIAVVSISSENDEVDIEATYEVTYIKYNDGWKLEKEKYIDGKVALKKSLLKEETAKKEIYREYDQEYISIELKDRMTNLYEWTDSFIFHATSTKGYLTQTDEIIVVYKYSLGEGWQLN